MTAREFETESAGGTGTAPAPLAGGVVASTSDELIDPMIGLLVDSRYRIDRRLARGGMATVYVAHDERLDRPVALKIMHPHLAESADFVARFRREARAAARIIHPGVVSVFDQGVVHGQGFLVMELIEGPNLRTLLHSQGAFSLGQTLRYIREILDALRAAHRVGVIHRDIKPENILVPNDPPIRVTDFGLARAASEVSMSTTGSMLGTVAYIAPEVATSARVDERTDIYAIGIMAYEMLTGAVPWHDENPLAIAAHHVNDSIPLPSAAEPWIPREVDDLVVSLAATNPDERPADAAEALELVARVAASLPAELADKRATVEPIDEGVDPTTMWEKTGMTSTLPVHATTSQRVVRAEGAAQGERVAAKRRSRLGTVLALITVLLITGGLSGWWWWTEYGPGSYLTMPETTGRATTAVESDLKAMGLVVVIEEDFSDTVAQGDVISSDPAGAAPVHKDAEVRLVSSKGIDMKVVPTITAISEDDATKALKGAGLAKGEVTQEYSEEVAEGTVISQAVEAGAPLAHDSTVDFVVSKGREPISVPDLTALTADGAKAAIEGMGLTAQPTEEFSDTVAQGQIISQSTAAGTTLHRGDPVAYVVSKGPEMVAVPQIRGKQEKDAKDALAAAGLEVKVERVFGGVFGTARSTDPEEGTMVKRGSTVTLYVV